MSWKVRWGGRGWPSFIVPATFCQDSWFKRQTDFSQTTFVNLASRLQTYVIIYVAWSMRACFISASVKEYWRRCTNCTMLFASCILPARWEIDNICTRPLYICTAYIYRPLFECVHWAALYDLVSYMMHLTYDTSGYFDFFSLLVLFMLRFDFLSFDDQI